MKKVAGRILMVVGVFLVLSALGQDGYETHAFLRSNSVIEAPPFWVLAAKILAGAVSLTTGYEISREKRR